MSKKAREPKSRRPTPPGAPVPLGERVKKSRAALVKRGGAKIPGGWLQPGPADALRYLYKSGYAPTRVGCIARALTDAAKLAKRRAARASKSSREAD